MKRFLLIQILFCFSSLFSQEYRPLLNPNNHWTLTYLTNENPPNEEIYTLNEQAYEFNGETYHNFDIEVVYNMGIGYFPNPYLREDIEEKKVYRYDEEAQEEYVLYDFGLQVGDIIPTDGFIIFDDYFFEYYTIRISDIIYEDMFGIENVKTFYLEMRGQDSEEYFPADFQIVEGIGNTQGIFSFQDFEWGTNLLDFETLGINEVSSDNGKMKIFPNPVKDYLNLDINGVDGVNIFSSDGKLLLAETINSEKRINVNSLKKGVYYIQVLKKNNVLYQSKFIKK